MPFLLGCFGFLATLIATIWIAACAIRNKPVSKWWLAAYVMMAAISFGTIVVTQPFIEVISRISSGGPDDTPGESGPR